MRASSSSYGGLRLQLLAFIGILLLQVAVALEVAPNSPCASVCLDTGERNVSDAFASSTTPPDIPCADWEVIGSNSTEVGRKWYGCMSCLQSSAYYDDKVAKEADTTSILFNMKSAVLWCMLGLWVDQNNPNLTDAYDDCYVSSCQPIAVGLNTAMRPVVSRTQYNYCTAANKSFPNGIEKCQSCMANRPGMDMLNNFLSGLVDACDQQPGLGKAAIHFSTPLFEMRTANATSTPDPSQNSETSSPKSGGSSGLSSGAVTGIAVGISVPIVIAIIIAAYWIYKRRVHHHERALTPSERAYLSTPMPLHSGGKEQWSYTKPVEMDTNELPQELEGQRPRWEVDAKSSSPH